MKPSERLIIALVIETILLVMALPFFSGGTYLFSSKNLFLVIGGLLTTAGAYTVSVYYTKQGATRAKILGMSAAVVVALFLIIFFFIGPSIRSVSNYGPDVQGIIYPILSFWVLIVSTISSIVLASKLEKEYSAQRQ